MYLLLALVPTQSPALRNCPVQYHNKVNEYANCQFLGETGRQSGERETPQHEWGFHLKPYIAGQRRADRHIPGLSFSPDF